MGIEDALEMISDQMIIIMAELDLHIWCAERGEVLERLAHIYITLQ